MKAIVAVDLDWGIGYKGNLLQRIPEDMKLFKRMTLGKVVVMGRETFESLPGKKPLTDRINILLSKTMQPTDDKIIICRSLGELFEQLKKYDPDDVFVIGGESIYTQLLPYCTEVYVTRIKNKYEADKYFTNLDKEEAWELVSEGDPQNYNDIRFNFLRYVKTSSLKGGKD